MKMLKNSKRSIPQHQDYLQLTAFSFRNTMYPWVSFINRLIKSATYAILHSTSGICSQSKKQTKIWHHRFYKCWKKIRVIWRCVLFVLGNTMKTTDKLFSSILLRPELLRFKNKIWIKPGLSSQSYYESSQVQVKMCLKIPNDNLS